MDTCFVKTPMNAVQKQAKSGKTVTRTEESFWKNQVDLENRNRNI
ncbi:hypothetical protein [Heyndrickxia camelliae]|nr:hypothetical protein [Heyndrickxia camelliae]